MASTPNFVPVDDNGEPLIGACSHLGEIRNPVPATPGECEDCVREGSTWVHLRLCQQCGHVGCCDSSPRRHATAHWNASHHPIISSAEPGEAWGWCYSDEIMLVPTTQ